MKRGLFPILCMLLLLLSMLSPALATTLYYYEGPDTSEDGLTLVDFRVTGEEPIELGNRINVSFEIINSNSAEARLGKNGIFLAVEYPDGSREAFGCIYRNYTLDPGESVFYSDSLYLTQPGGWSIWPSYELKLYDPIARKWYKKVGPEYWHAFNFTVEIPDKPDLVVEYLEVEPPLPVAGYNATLEVGIKNNGTAGSISCDGMFLIDSYTTIYVNIPGLNPSESIEIKTNYSFEESGTHNVSFIADPHGKVDEIFEDNNDISIDVEAIPGDIDLEAYKLEIKSDFLAVGGNATIRPFIRNLGKNRSISCVGTLYVDGDVLQNFSISPIRANGIYADVEIHWTPKEMGTHNLTLWVDSTEIITEENETNNFLTITVNVTGEDSNPPRVNVSYTPSTVTERDNVTFHVEAYDESGLEFVSLVIYTLTEPRIHAGKTDTMNATFNYTCGPFPRNSVVYFYVRAEDKAGNRYESPTYNFTVQSYYGENLTVNIYAEPENPTEFDQIMIYAEASYPYGVKELSIINYKYNHTLKRAENVSRISFGPIGPFSAGVNLSYIARAVDVDGHIAYSDILNITIGEVGFENERNLDVYANGMVFLTSDADWRTVLTLVPISMWREYNQSIFSILDRHVIRDEFFAYATVCIPTLVYHYESEDRIDTNPIINFLNYRWNPSKVVIIGDPPEDLLNKLIADKPVGAGLREDQIEIIPVEMIENNDLNVYANRALRHSAGLYNHFGVNLSVIANFYLSNSTDLPRLSDNSLWGLNQRFWKEINKVVITEDEYGISLLAAEYASLIDAPLLFYGHFDIKDIENKRVYLVGNFDQSEISEIEGYAQVEAHLSREELIDRLKSAGLGENIVLINPLDPWIGVDDYTPRLGFGKFYYKQSLLAPFLAFTKKALILEIPASNFTEIDSALQSFIDSENLHQPHIIILASPSAIPMARPNWLSHPALRGNKVYFEVLNYGDMDIKRNDLVNNTSFIFPIEGDQYSPFVAEDVEGAVNRDRNNRLFDICFLYSLTLEESSFPEGGGRNIVFQMRSDETRHDIKMVNYHEPIIGDAYYIANSTMDECKPDISEDDGAVVWQQKNESEWDICYIYLVYDGNGKPVVSSQYKHVIEKGGNQKNPSISGSITEGYKIVYQDDRNGNWDIYLYDTSNGSEIQITTDRSHQILPRISGDIVVWQDNRNGNWDIYMYNLSSGEETPVATSQNPEVKPEVNKKWIVWYEEGKDGLWYLWSYGISTGRKKLVDVTEVSHTDTHILYLQVDDRFYASKGNDGYMDYPTGRIFGLTTSDLSAYIATDILFDKMQKNRKALIIARGLSEDDERDVLINYTKTFWTTEVENEFTNYSVYATYEEVNSSRDQIISEFLDSYLTIFYDHGNERGLAGFVSSEDLEMRNLYAHVPSFLLNAGCATGAYNKLKVKQWLFVIHVLRSGRMNCLGFVDIGLARLSKTNVLCDGHGLNPSILSLSFANNKTIGESYMEGKNCCSCGSDVVILLGDPTIEPRWWD